MASLFRTKSKQSCRIPHLRNVANSRQLIVNETPFLMLAGELQNSSFSCPEHMQHVWSKLKSAHVNTVLGSVAWEQIEPTEGQFDFHFLDRLLAQVRSHGLHLVLLWFGSFKNGLSTYAPPWAKQDNARFPRAKIRGPNGVLKTADTFSIFGPEACKSDRKAFVALMQHIRNVDEAYGTVLMVQVENEVGILGDSRDYSELAEKASHEPVPDDLVQFLRDGWSGTNESFQQKFAELKHVTTRAGGCLHWTDLAINTPQGNELFMAYHYAHFVETVASAGKRVYPLPMYTNVWQNYGGNDADPHAPIVAGGGSSPGDYPSGGGVPDVLDVWQAFAPSLDFIAPDIYLNDYEKTCAKYRHNNNTLFIPEQRRDEHGALRIWSAFGSYQCIGTAPFGIDTVEPDLNPFRKHYQLLAKVSMIVIDAQARGNASIGFFFDELLPDGSDPSAPVNAEFGAWNLLIERSFVFGRPSPGSGMIIHVKVDEFLLIGWGFQVTFQSKAPNAIFTGLLKFEERDVVNVATGEMETLRWLNGDETRSGQHAIMPSEDPDYDGFPISITIPAGTGIAMCQPYVLRE
ncbi:glycoside hydrolase family 35 protein [Myriangium duriaei CBS 260.36]|uniref:Glycoside hydrolase family 35 protein n=1 Tax=Myriangium duriaei CBS 260.36 TaxID=1168546 RepID=A0A9P4MFV0_9PEZI|nr:glycoside hydrolase family 35 protein [Myriangium duriaei CBS 260.36]